MKGVTFVDGHQADSIAKKVGHTCPGKSMSGNGPMVSPTEHTGRSAQVTYPSVNEGERPSSSGKGTLVSPVDQDSLI